MTRLRTDASRAHAAAAARRRRRERAYGTWVDPRVDPTAAREHVLALTARGMSVAGVAKIAGLRFDAVHRLARGTSTWITRPTAEGVLGVVFDLDSIPDGSPVSSVGTQRRLRALLAMGWTSSWVARRIGMLHANHIFRWVNGTYPTVTARTARSVRDVYDELSMTPGPSAVTARRAARRGWVPPLAWEGVDIDDPAAVPVLDAPTDVLELDEVAVRLAMEGTRVELTAAERAEVVRRLVERGVTSIEIADRLGIDPRSVQRIRRQLATEAVA